MLLDAVLVVVVAVTDGDETNPINFLTRFTLRVSVDPT